MLFRRAVVTDVVQGIIAGGVLAVFTAILIWRWRQVRRRDECRGSIDIYIRNTPPAVHESNWLPAPAGNFMLWLLVYQPGAAILNGTYRVPPVVEVKGGR